jgi:hypothetical protein
MTLAVLLCGACAEGLAVNTTDAATARLAAETTHFQYPIGPTGLLSTTASF